MMKEATTRQPDPHRRQVFAAAAMLGAAALAPRALAQPQTPDGKRYPTEKFGALHRDAVDGGLHDLHGRSPSSAQGLKRLVDKLEKKRLLDENTAGALRRLIDLLTDAKKKAQERLEAAQKFARELLGKWRAEGNELIRALLSIVDDSIEWCVTVAKKLSASEKLQIVLDDFVGALVGAGAGAAAGALLGPISAALLAALGALGGAAAGSLKSAHEALGRGEKK